MQEEEEEEEEEGMVYCKEEAVFMYDDVVGEREEMILYTIPWKGVGGYNSQS